MSNNEYPRGWNLSYRQSKIQEKRKQTPFRDFVMEIASWFPLNFYRYNGMVTKYPDTERKSIITSTSDIGNHESASGEPTDIFLNDFSSLVQKSYQPNVNFYGVNENCDYSEAVYGAKNGYLSFSLGNNAENVLYSCFVRLDVTNIIDSFFVENGSENIYHSLFINKSSSVFFSKYITNSNNIFLSSNLVGCHECILCNNLENQSYCINNTQLSPEEYNIQKSQILANKSQFGEIYAGLAQAINNGTNYQGNAIFNSHNVHNAYFCRDVQKGNNIICGAGGHGGSSELYDSFDGGNDSHHFYGVGMSGTGSSHIYCSYGIGWSHNIFYSLHCEDCSFCLGCIGLKNKSYCILNKQYTKEERYEKVDDIFAQMEANGTLGQFFPTTMNPFYFNDTAAYLIDPLFTKEEVVAKGYLWRDEPIKVDIPEWMEVVESKDLEKYEGWMVGTQFLASTEGKGSKPDGENSVPTDAKRYIDPIILKKTIKDEEGNVYRVVKLEYDFLVKYGLPLPKKHWLARMKENFNIH